MYTLQSNDGCVILSRGTLRLRIRFVSDSIARITFTDKKPFENGPSFIVTAQSTFSDYIFKENPTNFTLKTSVLSLLIDKKTGGITYKNSNDDVLLSEPERGGKWLTAKKVYRSSSNRNAWISNPRNVDNCRDVFEAKLEFIFHENEALFGLGSHEEGYGNLRGKSRELYQHNRKNPIPYFVSTLNYGILVDCCSLMTFHDDNHGSYVWCDVVDELDYYFIHGNRFDHVTHGYHQLTGQVSLLPKYAFGYIQSKEKYNNNNEIISIIEEYRQRQIPIDTIVLDSRQFSKSKSCVDDLHQLNAHLMVSILPNMNEKDLTLADETTANVFSSSARQSYWKQGNENLFSHDIDGWCCEKTEPFVADWSSGLVQPEPHIRLVINVQYLKQFFDPGLINIYSLLHSQGIYEGQRQTTTKKRVLMLTHSSYAGQHRYGTVARNGDLAATWETLRRCIPEGIHYCASGEPYWTSDIGGYFLNSNEQDWFSNGQYSDDCSDLAYWELYLRWFQYGSFLPMFRSHGTDLSRDIWHFGKAGTIFYENLVKFIRLRYQLMPYIYSLVGQITLNSYTMIRAIAFDYPNDTKTFDLTDQYLFGSALMICPVTTSMYYENNSQPISNALKCRSVYLPAGKQWYDFWNETVYDGEQTISAYAPLDIIPLFVPSGSIIPMTEVMQYVNENPNAPYEIRIYRGNDGHFTIYEDAGDNYDYEKGQYALIDLIWNENLAQLTIRDRQGAFPELVRERIYKIIFISKQGRLTKTIHYHGKQVQISAL